MKNMSDDVALYIVSKGLLYLSNENVGTGFCLFRIKILSL